MKKKILGVFVSFLAVAMLTIPLVSAKPSTTVSGTIELASIVADEIRPAGKSDNVISILNIEEEWHGGIEATCTTVSTWIVHNGPMGSPNAWVNMHEKLTLSATVLDKSGMLTMEVNIAGTEGHWIIVGGTGELANLRGHGKLTLTTTPYSYTGQVHFHP